MKGTRNVAALAFCIMWLALLGQTASSNGIAIVPSDPIVSIGQTLQFAVSGAIVPTSVSAGGEYTCVLIQDASVRCTGRNQFGQLANGTFDDSAVLVPVNGLAPAASIVAGDEFACVLLADRTAACWGLGEKGQRGDGTLNQYSTVPVAVSGLTNATRISAGYNHACALIADGSIKCWGSNLRGELGDPSIGPGGSSVPVLVTGITSATAVTSGAFHACAVLADTTARCWGDNQQGQLGDGTFTSAAAPVTVEGLTGVVSIAGGDSHTCALLVNTTLRCWGNNYQGQLGDGTTIPSTIPVQVVGLSNVAGVSGGWQHTCAVRGDGTAWCWGEGDTGQLGDGNGTNSPTAVRVAGIAGAVGITAGWWHHGCALLGDGRVRCWGGNEWGQLGTGTTSAPSFTPVAMSGTGVTWTSSNPAVATIDTAGRATAMGSGLTTITATDSSGASGNTTLTVRSRFMLSIAPTGSGLGAVTSSPAGIACGTHCSELFDNGTTVTLTATPDGRSTFAGWNGCDTVSGATCTVHLTAARLITATFELKRFDLIVTKAGPAGAAGTVSSSPAGIDCGSDCSEMYTIDTVVTLTASPGPLLTGWSGCDAVSGATCTVAMGSLRSVTANFLAPPF